MPSEFKKNLRKLPFYSFFKEIFFNFIKLCKIIRNKYVPTAYIILYHRIGSAVNDPHQLSVTADNFRQHLIYLKNNFTLVKAGDLVARIDEGKSLNKFAAITFDDGYADNLEIALPILEELNVPATIFIVADKIGNTEKFYWDINSDGRALTLEELRRLAAHPLIEIGAHTLNHPNLGGLNREDQGKEINQSKIKIESMLERKINGFAYPFGSTGSFNSISMELVQDSGFKYACSTFRERVTAHSNKFALPRFVIRNWSLEEFKNNWQKFI